MTLFNFLSCKLGETDKSCRSL